MTYLFSNTVNVSNEVEIKNDANNAIPVTGNINVWYQNTEVTANNPLPVTLGSNTINIVGNISIPTTVNVSSSPENPVHVHLTEVGTFGNLTTYIPIQGNVNVGNNFIVHVDNFPEIQTVNGTINVGNTIQANIINWPEIQNVNVTNTVVVSDGNGSLTIDGNVGIVGTVTSTVVPGASDAFGRLRVSEPYTLADYSHVYGEEAELLTANSGIGSGTTTIPNEASIRLTVGTGPTDYVIHQSRMYHHYMPGKSQLALESFTFGQPRANTYKRVGLFGNSNGIYLQQDGTGTLSLVQRSNTTGTVIETMYTQNEWNVDTCNGTGNSAFNISTANSQLWWCDYQWLGVGRVRTGFVHNGEFIVAHQITHSNTQPTVYWSNPSLPVRCEIRNYGVAVGTTSMDQMCATVMSEGGYKESGVDFSADSGAISLIKGNPGAYKVCMAIRLKNAYKGQRNRSIVRLAGIDMFADSASCQWELWRLPSNTNITGGSWVSAGDDSVVEYNATAGTSFNTTNGNKMNSGWVAANNPSGKQASGSSALTDPSASKQAYISQNINSNDSNLFVLIARDLSPTADTSFYASIQWRETR
jgi:hypothetical protein